MAKRKNPSRFIGGPGFDSEKFADQERDIRSGLCPNGHGKLTATDYGQKCPACGFFTNSVAEPAIH